MQSAIERWRMFRALQQYFVDAVLTVVLADMPAKALSLCLCRAVKSRPGATDLDIHVRVVRVRRQAARPQVASRRRANHVEESCERKRMRHAHNRRPVATAGALVDIEEPRYWIERHDQLLRRVPVDIRVKRQS